MIRGPADRRIATLDKPPVIERDGAVPFLATWSLCVPTQPGVYVISDLRGPLYVGRSGDLRRRFGDHLADTHNKLLAKAIANPVGQTQFLWITADGKHQAGLEAQLIEALMPVCNVLLNRRTGSAGVTGTRQPQHPKQRNNRDRKRPVSLSKGEMQ